MKVIKLGPVGPCRGVKLAIDEVVRLHVEKPDESLFLSHPLVHNFQTNQLLEKETGATALKSFSDDCLSTLPPGSTVIFSAHGHSRKEEQILDSKKIKHIDCFCPLLKAKYASIEKAYQNGGSVLFYVGKKEHQETIATMDHFPSLNFISSLDNPSALNFEGIQGKSVIVFRQSTIVNYPFETLKSIMLEKGAAKVRIEKACPFLDKRFLEINKVVKSDFCAFVVVGDKTSSNANELCATCKDHSPSSPVYLVPDKENLKNFDFSDIQTVYLLSATSSLESKVDEVEKALIDLKN